MQSNVIVRGGGKHDLLTKGGIQTLNFIPEGDLYRLIAHSKLPAAERFEKWVFDEILPAIRRTGSYGQTIPADMLNQLVVCTQVLTQSVQVLAQEIAVIKAGQADPQTNQAALPAVESKSTGTGGFMDSMEISLALKRKHNQVLRTIRRVMKHGDTDCLPVQKYFLPANRRGENNVRYLYFQVTWEGVRLICRSLRDEEQVEELEKAWELRKNK